MVNDMATVWDLVDLNPLLNSDLNIVPVVLCKDCMFSTFNSSNGTFRCMSHNCMNRTVGEHEFCSYGERGDN